MKLPCAWQPPPLILEHYQLRRWLFLGAGRLGDQAVLWGKRIVNRSQLNEGAQVGQTQLKTTQDPYRDPFHVYAHKFTVFVPARFRRTEQAAEGAGEPAQGGKPGPHPLPVRVCGAALSHRLSIHDRVRLRHRATAAGHHVE